MLGTAAESSARRSRIRAGSNLIVEIGVRRGHQVGGAGIGGHAEHGSGFFKRLGAVVKGIQDVAVDVDQFSV